MVDPSWTRVGELHLDLPPLLVVAVASPSTRRADPTRKLADYKLGGAGVYVLVDLPGSGGANVVVFEAHDLVTGQVAATGAIDLVVAGRPSRPDLTKLAPPHA